MPFSLSLFELAAALVVVTALFAWVNHRFFHLPLNIGLLLMGLFLSLLLLVVRLVFPELGLMRVLSQTIGQVDFSRTVFEGMLAFLLFAGALTADISQLRQRAPLIAALASVGVMISMVLMATGLWGLAQLFGLDIDFRWALVFGAIVAPTDPVAVLAILKSAGIPRSLEMDIAGEALFNDGVAIVLFTVALQFAMGSNQDNVFLEGAGLMAREAGGGILLGLVTGYIAYRAIHALDDYAIEVLISLALAMGTYALASRLHLSGPIAVVVTGVLIGNHGVASAMSDKSRRYLLGFWSLVDDILNAVLFLLIGLEVLVLHFEPTLDWIALCVVPLALLARYLAVGVPVFIFDRYRRVVRGSVSVMTWGGVRGGISIALALSLPFVDERLPILMATYAVVLFSVVVQGLTLPHVVRYRVPRQARSGGAGEGDENSAATLEKEEESQWRHRP